MATEVDVLHIEDLEMSRCSNPECKEEHDTDVLYLHAHCHPDAGIDAMYVKKDGTLHLICKECDMLLAIFQVAHLPPGRMQ